MKKRHLQPEYNFIADGIYLGTNQCCQTHFEEGLLNLGIKADISLEQEQLDSPWGVEMYLWLPVKDHQAPTLAQLELGVAMIERLVLRRIKVYLHCKNGHGRAPTLLAAFFVKNGQTIEQAVKYIKTKRPAVHLEAVQIKALGDFQKKFQ